MNQPLVSVICVCYNHARFVVEALDSVVNQTYKNIELIVIDDGSDDGSGKIIKQWVAQHPATIMLLNGKNLGYCITFNKAFRFAKGDYIIDLSADDLLLPQRIEEGVKLFQSQGLNCDVIFSDARYIDKQGKELHLHSDNFPHDSIPQGEIYKDLIKRYFICSPTMMIRKEVLVKLNGYDESLAFEDFDLWIRASRDYEFYYSPNVFVKKRIVNSSLSKKQFTRGDTQRWSTLKVCAKIKSLNRTIEERVALRKRLWYEIRLSLQLGDFALAWQFSKLLL